MAIDLTTLTDEQKVQLFADICSEVVDEGLMKAAIELLTKQDKGALDELAIWFEEASGDESEGE